MKKTTFLNGKDTSKIPLTGWLLFSIMLLCGTTMYSQTGALCEDPIVITSLPYTTSDDTANYADNYDPSTSDSPVCATTTSGNFYHSGNDVIYAYTPAEDTSINIHMPNGVAWSAMFVYADCADIGLEYAACATSTSSGDREINDFLVTGGQTYYILLSIWATPQTFEYTLNITENSCTNHAVDFGVAADCDNGPQFFVTADVTGMGSAASLTISDDQGSEPQVVTALGEVTFGPFPNGTPVVLTVANTDDASCVVASTSLTQLACPPANDDCAGAIALTVNEELDCTAVTAGTTLGATESMESGECNGNPDDDVWFSFEASDTSHMITLSNITAVSGTSTDMYFQVLEGTCDGAASLLCSDNNTNTVTGLTPGETYFVRVYSYGTTSRQTFDICVASFPPAPANDDCEGAVALTVNDGLTCDSVTSGTTVSATESMESGECNGNPDDDVWFSFEASAATHIVTLSNVTAVLGSSTDMYFQVLEGTCDGATSLLCSDNNTNTVTGLTPGETYFVRVYSYGTTSRQTFDICITTMPPAPANDNCEGAIALTVNDGLTCDSVTSGTTVSATESMESGECNGNPDDDVWFSFEATATSHRIALSNVTAIFGTSTDMYFQVLSGSCDSTESVLCSDNNAAIAEGLTPGQVYFVRVYSYATSSRQTFDICVGTIPPPATNDDCDEAIVLTVNADLSCDTVITGTTLGATESMESGECNGNPDDDVWFSFEALAESHYISLSNVVAVSGSSTDMYFQVLEGTCDGTATSLLCSDANTNTVTGLTPGEVYFIRVYSYATSSRQVFDLCVGTFPPPPANDECAGAITLIPSNTFEAGSIAVSNAGATHNDADDLPECDDSGFEDSGKDIWFTVTVPASGSISIETRGNGDTMITDTGIEAYTGTCGALVSVECNADDGDGNFSLLELNGLTPGEVLVVRAWGYNGTFGSFDIAAYDASIDPCADVLAPEGNEAQELLLGQTLASLDVTGENLTWYSDAELTTEIPDTTVAVDGTVYYVTQTVGECVSDALEITVTVTDPCAGVIAPEGDEEQSFTAGQTLADLDVTGENLTWYSDEALTVVIEDTTVLEDGVTYYVTQTVGECVSEALEITVNEVLGTDGFDAVSFRYYPNPVSGVLNLSYAKEITNVAVYNMVGQQVFNKQVNAAEAQVNLSHLAAGSYIVKVTAGDAVKTVRIIKN